MKCDTLKALMQPHISDHSNCVTHGPDPVASGFARSGSVIFFPNPDPLLFNGEICSGDCNINRQSSAQHKCQ
jgi:hypothetical protein